MSEDVRNVVVAVNMVQMVNRPEAFARMELAGPKMCALTASQPGFLGYQANIQIGALSMAGRYGGARPNMMAELNPIKLWQYTVWDGVEAHAGFHRDNFARVFEICSYCAPELIEGPWEPIYQVVAAQMPVIRTAGQLAATGAADPGLRHASPQRAVALGVHTVKQGQEQAFEAGARATMEALADAPGFLGYMIMEQIGVSPWGSLQLDPQSMLEMVTTFGANPPVDPSPLFEETQARLAPTEYLVHSEWETAELAAAGIARVFLEREVRALHGEVLQTLVSGPYVTLFSPMMEQASWRDAL